MIRIGPMLRLRTVLALSLAFAAPAAVALAPRTAAAQSEDEIKLGKQMAGDGLAAYKKGDYDRALGLFDQAVQLYPSGNILRMHGYTLLALEKWGDALDQMEKALDTKVGPLSDEERKDVTSQMAKAKQHFHFVLVKTNVADAELRVDGRPVELPLSKPLRLLPGKHSFQVRAKGHEDVTEERDLETGKETELVLDPKKIELDKPKEKKFVTRTKGWFGGQDAVGIGLFAGGLAVGAAGAVVGGISAANRAVVEADVARHLERFPKGCGSGTKTQRQLCEFDRAVVNNEADVEEQTRWTAIGLGIGGGAILATGGLFWLFSEKGPAASKEKVEVQARPACAPIVGPGGFLLTCGGQF